MLSDVVTQLTWDECKSYDAHSLYLDRLGLLPAQPRNIARFFCHQTSLIFRILFLVLAFIIWDTWQDQKRLISAAGILAIVGFGAGNSPTFIVGPGLLITRFLDDKVGITWLFHSRNPMTIPTL